MSENEFAFGIDRLLCEHRNRLADKRFGLLMNQASVTRDLQYSSDVLARVFPDQFAAICSPQHGLWGEQQANMIESEHAVHPRHGIPVYSLYQKTRWPTEQMLDGLDCLVVDLQDVGTRVYTYIWTVTYCLDVCAKHDVEVLVLDRPNPLGGKIVEGPILDPDFSSFVGRYPIPMRHALTLGEFAAWANHRFNLQADLRVIPMLNWSRDQMWHDLARVWIPPSPNMPRFESAVVYPGQVLLEGTNLSEGRGTTRPFEVIGAPFIDADRLMDNLAEFDFPGLELLPIRFAPTFDKWQGASCGGIAIYVTDPHQVRSYEMTVRICDQIRQLWPDDFDWICPPYEYEKEKTPIDILSGNTVLRETISTPSQDLSLAIDVDATTWNRQVQDFHLY